MLSIGGSGKFQPPPSQNEVVAERQSRSDGGQMELACISACLTFAIGRILGE